MKILKALRLLSTLALLYKNLNKKKPEMQINAFPVFKIYISFKQTIVFPFYKDYTIPCAVIASTTFKKPAMLAPAT